MSRTNSSPFDHPLSIEDIVHAAGSQKPDPRFSMTTYFRSAGLLVKQANIYEHEGNDQMAYLLLYRHADLILGQLSKHPRAKDVVYKHQWGIARKEVQRSLAKLEVLKPRIEKAYQRYEEKQRIKAVREAAKGTQASRASEGGLEDDMRRLSLDSGQRSPSPVRLDPLKHRDEAVALANRVSQRRTYRSMANDDDSQDVSAGLINARRQVEQQPAPRSPPARTSSKPNTITKYRYPTVPENEKTTSPSSRSFADRLPSFTSIKHQPPQFPPQRPPKQQQTQQPTSSPPPRPLKTSITTTPTPPVPSKPSPSPTSTSPKAAQQFRTTSTLESGAPLRTLFLPSTLHTTFLSLASTNTRRNLETCGILIGTLLRNAFFVSHLLLPAQDCTSDTCEMRDETQLYEFIESHASASDDTAADPGNDLMVLGWIHTHPSQTCFLSSADLHTHLGYQLSLSESVAIVCSPSQRPPNDFGVFRLTDPPGLGVIKACERRGLFHPHEVPRSGGGLFTDGLRDGAAGGGEWGHVVSAEGLRFEVVDMRD